MKVWREDSFGVGRILRVAEDIVGGRRPYTVDIMRTCGFCRNHMMAESIPDMLSWCSSYR